MVTNPFGSKKFSAFFKHPQNSASPVSSGRAPDNMRFRWINIVFWSLSLIIIYNLICGDSSCLKRRGLNQQISHLQDSLLILKKQYDSLQLEEKRLIYDPKYIEKIAREKLGMVRKDEKVYRYYDKDSVNFKQKERKDDD